MKKRTPVSKIMTSNLISLNTVDRITDAVRIFKDYNIHHIPVLSGNRVKGLISKTDIDRISFVNRVEDDKVNTAVYDMLDIEQVMTKDVDTVQIKDTIKETAEILARGKYHALPVMEGDDIKGIVTTTDVINYLLEQY